MNRLLAPLILLIVVSVLYLSWVVLTPAQAHSWYPPRCCSGGDCMPVPEGGAWPTPTGFHVRFTDPVWGAVDEDVEQSKADISKDGQYHVCLKPAGMPQRIRCFFAPLNS